jgi:hypothetical protein
MRKNGQSTPLFPIESAINAPADPQIGAYEPLPSVWFHDDAELIERMLVFYPRTPPKLILDATVNAGRFWRGSRREIIGLDIEAKRNPTIIGDNTRMPFASECMDVVVYDPSHIPNQGRDQ